MNKIYLLLTVLVFTGCLTGCDEADNPTSPSLALDSPAPTFAADADTLRVTKDGVAYKVNVTQNTSYRWTAVSSQTAWCKLDVASTDTLSGSKQLTVTVVPYDLVNPRTANITLKEVGNRTITINVQQSGADPAIALAPTVITINDAEGGSDNIAVTANCTWTAVSNASWCTISPATGSGNATVKATVSRNIAEEATRTATITFTAVSLVRTVTVTQNGTTYIPPQPPDNTTTIYFEDLVIVAGSNSAVGNEWTLTDRRDGKAYKVRMMEDNRVWMIADLCFGGVPDIVAAKNTFTANSETVVGVLGAFIPDYYGDIVNITYNGSTDIEPRARRGYFYNWMAALQKADVSDGSGYEKVQGICPAGWHIPDRSEFEVLRTAFNNNKDGALWGEDAGTKFFGVWGGDIDGGTRRNWGLGNYGYYWSSTKNASNNAIVWCINKPGYDVTNANIYIEDNGGGVAEPAKKNKNGGALIRCVRN